MTEECVGALPFPCALQRARLPRRSLPPNALYLKARGEQGALREAPCTGNPGTGAPAFPGMFSCRPVPSRTARHPSCRRFRARPWLIVPGGIRNDHLAVASPEQTRQQENAESPAPASSADPAENKAPCAGIKTMDGWNRASLTLGAVAVPPSLPPAWPALQNGSGSLRRRGGGSRRHAERLAGGGRSLTEAEEESPRSPTGAGAVEGHAPAPPDFPARFPPQGTSPPDRRCRRRRTSLSAGCRGRAGSDLPRESLRRTCAPHQAAWH